MKQFKTLIILAIFFSLTVRSFSQTPDRVLSAEEFRQQKIEEKRQQLKREIQVRKNDRMRIFYDESIVLDKPYVKALLFLDKKYEIMDEIKDAVRNNKKNEPKIIFANTTIEINQMFLADGNNIIYSVLYPSSSMSVKQIYNLFNNYFEKLVRAFNEFLAVSPENREKVAQAIRDYRLAEYIKNELPDIEAERNTLTSSNYRFIGFTIGFGPIAGYSDALYIWNPKSEGDGIVFNFDVEFKYINLYRINNTLHIGFSIELGYWTPFFMHYMGSKILFSLKSNRFLFEIGGYLFFKIAAGSGAPNNVYLKPIDFGTILSLNYLLGIRMNYLLGIELRLNLNKSTRKTDNLKIDEAGYLAFLIKFGYGF